MLSVRSNAAGHYSRFTNQKSFLPITFLCLVFTGLCSSSQAVAQTQIAQDLPSPRASYLQGIDLQSSELMTYEQVLAEVGPNARFQRSSPSSGGIPSGHVCKYKKVQTYVYKRVAIVQPQMTPHYSHGIRSFRTSYQHSGVSQVCYTWVKTRRTIYVRVCDH